MPDRTTTYCSRWKITLADGAIFRFTDHDRDLNIGGEIYKASVGYGPSAIQSNVALSPDNMDLMGIIDDTGIKEADLLAGRFDYAKFESAIVDYKDLGAGDIYPLIHGRLNKVTVRDGIYHVELDNLVSQYTQNIGRIIQIPCDADLGDARCGYTLVPDALAVTAGTETSGNRRAFFDSNLIFSDDHYNLGKVTWQTGLNAGYEMDIKDSVGAGSQIILYEPMPFDIQIGDTGIIQVGCNKLSDQCKAYGRYDTGYRGFPLNPGLQKLMEGPR